jgi:hypothetical protein
VQARVQYSRATGGLNDTGWTISLTGTSSADSSGRRGRSVTVS